MITTVMIILSQIRLMTNRYMIILVCHASLIESYAFSKVKQHERKVPFTVLQEDIDLMNLGIKV